MKLRLKMSITLVGIAVPVVAFFSAYRMIVEGRTMVERASERAALRYVHRPPLQCAKSPQTWEHRHRGWIAYAYDAELRSQNPKAGEVPIELLDELKNEQVAHFSHFGRADVVVSIVEVNVSDACRYVALFWSPHGHLIPVSQAVIEQVLIVFAILTVTSFLISAPLVRRIRRLTQEVRKAPESGHHVEGEIEARDEIGDMARAFNEVGSRVEKTIEELRRRDEALKSYVANTTHDLAIPLTVLQHRLRRAKEQAQDPETQEHVRAALEESVYMAGLVRNLNVTAKLEASELYFKPEQVDFVDVAARVSSRFEPLAEMRDIEFNAGLPDPPFQVYCDSTLAEQAISNLVQNAIQYTEAGGHVALVLESHGDRFVLRVIDDGPGIPDELQKRVLEPRQRDAVARTRNPEGLGLGLSISQEICELHGWSLELQSPGRGVEATISGLCGVVKSDAFNKSKPVLS